MKNKYFYTRIINLLLIALVLVAYQGVVNVRAKQEELVRCESQLEAAQETIDEVKAQLNGTAQGEETENSGETTEEEGAAYVDGTYTGEADGFGGKIEVEVQIEGGKIAAVEIVSAKEEDAAYLTMASALVDDIVEEQSAEVDTVSGATFSSNGIKNAAADALKKAVKE